MSGVIGQFAEDLSDAASAVGNVNTDGITGGFGTTLVEQKASLVGVLEDFSAALTQLQEVADEHRRSEATFVATAPTLAEIAEAEKALLDLQAAGPSITSGTSVVPTLMGITDLAYMQAVENAQRRFTQLSQERRDAMRIFIDAQNRLSERINGTDIPSSIERTSRERGSAGSLGSSPSGANSSVIPGGFTSPGVRSPNAGAVGRGEASDSSSPSGGGDAQRPSTQDVLAAGTPVSEMGAAPMVVPQAGMGNPGMIPGRFGPQVAPGYVLPGTATSAGQVTPMPDRDFNSLLDRLRSDRMGGASSAPTTVAGSGGGGGAPTGGPAAAPRVVQPTSWVNASTSPTGVSEGQNNRAGAASSSPSARPGMMPPMVPMSQMSPNGGAGSKDSKDQPQIKNADPDVYGDDVKTIDPIIDNKGGRFA